MTLVERDATDLAADLRRGALSAAEVMAAFLDRIAQINPMLNAVVALREREELMAEAAAADRLDPRGPLHGLPLAVKDSVATKGIRTTSGSPLFADHVPQEDDGLARRLKAAGAILIGKTNTPEFGLGSHTYNPVYGATRNPYSPDLTPGGSSGGAAAALAARMLPLADGSDMMGSLRNPAAWCNVYGFRPTVGLVPPDPIADVFGPGLSTEGPMGRSPRDLALLLSVMVEEDRRYPYSQTPSDLLGLGIEIAGKRIGWLGDWGGAYPFEDGILDLCRSALMVFENLGAIVEEVPPPFPAERIWASWTTLRSAAVATKHRALYADPARRDRLKPEAVWEIERGLGLTAMQYLAASAEESAWYVTLVDLFGRYDALALPSAQVWPFPAEWAWPREVAGRPMDTYHRWMETVVPVSLSAVPALGLPVGFGSAGLPMGLQIFGPRGSDRRLLQIGQAYHGATDWPRRRRPPIAGGSD